MKLFITGTFRSGTTLALQILNISPEIEITYDTIHFMRFCYARYGKKGVAIKDALNMADDVAHRLKQRKLKEFKSNYFKKALVKTNKKYFSYGFLYDRMMRGYLNQENWGDRTDLQWRNALDLFKMFDDIYVLHLIRDPRDVLASWQKMTYAPGNDYLDAISNCFDSMKFAIENQKKFPHKYYVLQFEKLVKEPEKQVKKICKFLGIKFKKEMLDTSNFKSKLGGKWDPSKHTSFKDKIDGISTKPIGRWKKNLSKEDILLTEIATMRIMQYFDYEPWKKNKK